MSARDDYEARWVAECRAHGASIGALRVELHRAAGAVEAAVAELERGDRGAATFALADLARARAVLAAALEASRP